MTNNLCLLVDVHDCPPFTIALATSDGGHSHTNVCCQRGLLPIPLVGGISTTRPASSTGTRWIRSSQHRLSSTSAVVCLRGGRWKASAMDDQVTSPSTPLWGSSRSPFRWFNKMASTSAIPTFSCLTWTHVPRCSSECSESLHNTAFPLILLRMIHQPHLTMRTPRTTNSKMYQRPCQCPRFLHQSSLQQSPVHPKNNNSMRKEPNTRTITYQSETNFKG
jgi:hypothetical protein